MKKISIARMFVLLGLYALFANFAHPVTPSVIKNLGLHDYMFGVAFASMAITNFIFSPFWAKIPENYGCIKTSAFCCVGYGLSQFVFMIARSELGIVMARAIAGFFISGLSVNQLIYIMQNSANQKRGRDLAVAATIHAVCGPFGFLIGGFIGDYSIDLAFIFQIVGLISLGGLYLLFLDDKPTKVVLPFRVIIRKSNPFQVIIDSKGLITKFLLVFFIIVVTTSFASNCYDQCFNYFIKDQFNFPPSYNGLLKATVGFITLIANPTVSLYLIKKTNVKLSIVPVLVVCLMMLISIVVVKQVVPFIIINVVFFSCNAIYGPLIQATLAEVTKKDNGVVVGLYNSMGSLGMVAGSLFAGFIYSVGPRLSFVFSAVAFMVAIIAAIVNYYQSKKQETMINLA